MISQIKFFVIKLNKYNKLFILKKKIFMYYKITYLYKKNYLFYKEFVFCIE